MAFCMENEKLFEVQTVTHHHDLIEFTWTDIGGDYHVYRNGQHLYEGTVAEFGDGDFKHAKMYNYSIERVVHGEVVDVIALQTSAFAEQRNVKNPLQFLVMTTIVAKTQIALSWEEIKDVGTYRIYRNGVYMKTVKGNRFIDRNFSLDETYTYRVYSKRALSKSDERMSRSKSVVATMFGWLTPAARKRKPAFENFTVTKLVAQPRGLLTPVMEKKSRSNVDQWKFRYATFLREAAIKNPNPLSRNHMFRGDGRGFDAEGETFRTCVNVELDYSEKQSPMKFRKEIGHTIAFNHFGQVRKRGTASSEGIVLKRSDHNRDEAGFLLTHGVGNPLVKAPEIDYEVRTVFRRDGTFDMTGYHDQAPYHEIYIVRGGAGEWLTIHRAESQGLAWMSGIIGWQYWRCSNFE